MTRLEQLEKQQASLELKIKNAKKEIAAERRKVKAQQAAEERAKMQAVAMDLYVVCDRHKCAEARLLDTMLESLRYAQKKEITVKDRSMTIWEYIHMLKDRDALREQMQQQAQTAPQVSQGQSAAEAR